MADELPPEDIRKAMLTGTKGPSRRTKLTKKFLMELPTGVFLVSNCSYKGIPIVMADIPPIEMRDQLWKVIKARDVDQRLCAVFNNKREYEIRGSSV